MVSMAWIDKKKSFDSVLHSWIIIALKIYKRLIKSPSSKKKFQGDSLSWLLFYILLILLTNILKIHNLRYILKEEHKVSHFL